MDDEVGLIMNAFFTQSEPGKTAGRAYLERLKLRADNAPVSKQPPALSSLLSASGRDPQTDRFACWVKSTIRRWLCMGARTVVIRSMHSFSLSISPIAQLINVPMRTTAQLFAVFRNSG